MKEEETNVSADMDSDPSVPRPRRRNARLNDKIEVLDWYHANGRRQAATVAHFVENRQFTVTQPTLSRWLKQEAQLRRLTESSGPISSAHHVRLTPQPLVQEALAKWVEEMVATNPGCAQSLTNGHLREQAIRIYHDLGIPPKDQAYISSNYFRKFRDMVGLPTNGAKRRVVQALSDENVQKRLKASLDEFLRKHSVEDIFCMGDVWLAYNATPFDDVNETRSMAWLQVLLAVNSTGDERLDPLFTGSMDKDGTDQDVQYMKGSLSPGTVQHWLYEWNESLQRTERSILVLSTSTVSRGLTETGLTNIQLVTVSEGDDMVHHPFPTRLQFAFRAVYRRLLATRAAEKVTTTDRAQLFDVDQTTALDLADMAWRYIKPDLVSTLFQVGVFGSDEREKAPIAIDQVKNETQVALSYLYRKLRKRVDEDPKVMNAEMFIQVEEQIAHRVTPTEAMYAARTLSTYLQQGGDHAEEWEHKFMLRLEANAKAKLGLGSNYTSEDQVV